MSENSRTIVSNLSTTVLKAQIVYTTNNRNDNHLLPIDTLPSDSLLKYKSNHLETRLDTTSPIIEKNISTFSTYSENRTRNCSLNHLREKKMSVGDDTIVAKGKQTSPPTTPVQEPMNLPSPPIMEPLAPVRKRRVGTGKVSCQWLFNAAQGSSSMMLIDTRSREQFEEDTIPSAISIPEPNYTNKKLGYDLKTLEESLLPEQRHLFRPMKRKLREIVLFGDAVKVEQNGEQLQEEWIYQLEKLIIQEGIASSVKCLNAGFVTFKYRYPFYTVSMSSPPNSLMVSNGLTRTASGSHNLNYPNEVLEGFLFLGNMWHAQSKRVIKELGITHIVNASLDIGNEYADEGVLYHEVLIKDKPDANIGAHFDSTYAFIDSAKRKQHGKVLVHCTQGISRSSTLVIMYLMRINRWSLVTAVNYTLRCRGVAYPNQGFMAALMQDELRLYQGSSISVDEIDALLQHQLPDRPVPIQNSSSKSEVCGRCMKSFSLLEWRHKCSCCRKKFCSKCSSTKLTLQESDMPRKGSSDRSPSGTPPVRQQFEGKAKRVCDTCVSRLWKINLPRPRMGGVGYMIFGGQSKSLNVRNLSTFDQPICISYYDGTESLDILNVIKLRFDIQPNQIVDIALENGERVSNLAELIDGTMVFVSIGNAGSAQNKRKSLPLDGHNTKRPQQRKGVARSRRERSEYAMTHLSSQFSGLQSSGGPTDGLSRRERFSSEGSIDTLIEQQQARISKTQPLESKVSKHNSHRPRRSNSWNHEKAKQFAASLVCQKFEELWKLSFPCMTMIPREELMAIENPQVLMDLLLGMSSLACGALTMDEFHQRLDKLDYSEEDRSILMSLFNKSIR